MSYTAIAAALALPADISAGERLAAFSLASFADRDSRARPGTPAAAARAGLARSAFLEARARLEQRGLVVIEAAGTGRGRASLLALPFAVDGPWWDGDINAPLFEAVLGYSSVRGAGRLLLGALAALSDAEGVVDGLTTSRLCAAAGISDRTYRRVFGALVASGAAVLDGSVGGRGRLNRWTVVDPRACGSAASAGSARRVAPPAGARPLVAAVAPPSKGPAVSGVVNGGQDRTLSAPTRPAASGVPASNPGQRRTLPAQTPAETPAQTPAPHVRAGSRPQNPRTTADPPTPRAGGLGSDQVVVQETYVSDRGRKRTRQVTVDLAEVRERLAAGTEADAAVWERARALLLDAVGESQFEIWLARLELIAVDQAGTLLLTGPDGTQSWIRSRFGRLLDRTAESVGRGWRFADAAERAAFVGLAADADAGPTDRRPTQLCDGPTQLRDGSPSVQAQNPPDTPDRSLPDLMIGGMADTPAYTQVHKQAMEVS